LNFEELPDVRLEEENDFVLNGKVSNANSEFSLDFVGLNANTMYKVVGSNSNSV